MSTDDPKDTTGIYACTNTIDATVYVGSASVTFRKRWNAHKALLRLGKHANPHLQRAWNRDGTEAFVFSIIEVVTDLATILEREQYWIDQYRSRGKIYNVAIGVAPARYSRTEDERQKISAKKRGGKWSDEQKKRIRAIWTPERRQEFSQRQAGKTPIVAPEKLTARRERRTDPVFKNGNPRMVHDGFIAPDGTEYRNIINVAAFAESHGISAAALAHVNSGEQLSHKGWRRITPVRAPLRNRRFAFISPNGIRYENITNVSAFAAEHGLDRSTLAGVFAGTFKQHKGWRKAD